MPDEYVFFFFFAHEIESQNLEWSRWKIRFTNRLDKLICPRRMIDAIRLNQFKYVFKNFKHNGRSRRRIIVHEYRQYEASLHFVIIEYLKYVKKKNRVLVGLLNGFVRLGRTSTDDDATVSSNGQMTKMFFSQSSNSTPIIIDVRLYGRCRSTVSDKKKKKANV